MPAYFIAQYVVKNPKLYREYQAGAGPTIQAAGGELVAFDVAAETVEVHRGPGPEGYRETARVTGVATLTLQAFPDVQLSAAEIFA